jgi:hypothetical protein
MLPTSSYAKLTSVSVPSQALGREVRARQSHPTTRASRFRRQEGSERGSGLGVGSGFCVQQVQARQLVEEVSPYGTRARVEGGDARREGQEQEEGQEEEEFGQVVAGAWDMILPYADCPALLHRRGKPKMRSSAKKLARLRVSGRRRSCRATAALVMRYVLAQMLFSPAFSNPYRAATLRSTPPKLGGASVCPLLSRHHLLVSSRLRRYGRSLS